MTIRRATLHWRRGFALPTVMLLSTVGVVVVASMLTRYGSQNRFVRRHMHRYVEHHTQRGVQEIVGVWLHHVSGGPISDVIREDGQAFVVDYEGGRRLEVYIRDGQGTLLTNTAAMSDNDRAVIDSTLVEMYGRFTPDEILGATRGAGPASVSVASASEEVLRMVLMGSGLPESTADRIAGELVQERQRGGITKAEVIQILDSLGVTPESRTALVPMLTDAPSLWTIEALVYDRPLGEATARYEGLVEAEGGNSRTRNAQSRFTPTGPFLSWEVLDVK